MQKQLLIIGNGFDLNCGLKSSYIDFYDACIRKKTFEDEPNNFWQRLLCQYNKTNYSSNNNWCDIEEIIRETLHSVNYYGGTPIFRIAWQYTSQREDPIFYENDPIYNFILRYCVKYYYKNIFSEIFESTNTIPIEEIRIHINTHLLQELKNLEKQFCEYLKSQLSNKYLAETTYLFGDLLFPSSQNYSVTMGDFEHVNVLSFNFTNPLEIIYEKKLSQYSNVHGTLCGNKCKNCSASNVIFGIDDSQAKKEKENYLRLFSKTYRTLLDISDTPSVLPPKDGKTKIKFFGHSLNKADYSYFQSIFDYYGIYEHSGVSLEFFYAPFKDNAKDETADKVYNLINQYGSTLTNKDQGKNLMHKLILEKRIKISEIPITKRIS